MKLEGFSKLGKPTPVVNLDIQRGDFVVLKSGTSPIFVTHVDEHGVSGYYGQGRHPFTGRRASDFKLLAKGIGNLT